MNRLNGSFYFDRPFPVQTQEIQVMLSGRIDNRSDLLEIFKAENLPLPESGPEIIKAAFKIWGLAFASHLQGEFAAALWDGKNKQLVLARDPLGLKQLYYFHDPKKILFSSRIHSLFENPEVPKKINESMLGQFFTGEFLDYESTFFEKIVQVPPAHILIFQSGSQIQKKRFWSIDTSKTRVYQDKNQYLEEFYGLFESSVRRKMETPAPAGLLLSGGLDSVQICAAGETLRRKNNKMPPLKSACLMPEGFLCEEKENLDSLLKTYQIDVEMIDYHSKAQNVFELYLEPGEMPYYDAFLTVPLLLKKLAAKGCKTVMTGYGANEFSNLMEFGYLEDLLLTFKFGQLSEEAERFAQCVHSPVRDVKKMIFMEVLREKTPYLARKVIRARRLNARKWLRPEFRNKVSTLPPPRLRPFGKLAQDETYHALFEPIIALNLAQMSEAAEKQGLEISHPFMDLPLIEFFLSIPVEIKMEGGYRKNFTQRALAPVMPIPVKTQDDERVFIPFKDEKTRVKLELSRIIALLSNPKCPLYEYIDFNELQKLLNPNSQVLDYPLFWRLIRLDNWLKGTWGSS